MFRRGRRRIFAEYSIQTCGTRSFDRSSEICQNYREINANKIDEEEEESLQNILFDCTGLREHIL